MIVAVLVLGVASAALAQDATSTTSQEPLQRVLDGFVSGEESDLFLEGQTDSIVSQFQMVVNLGETAGFSYQDMDIAPTGLAESGLDPIDLSSQFERSSTDVQSYIAPLDPWTAGSDEGTDITSLIEGWEAYGETGLIEGPVLIQEPSTLIWGIELAEPFDTTCATEQRVGRAWSSIRFGEPEQPFTAAELSSGMTSAYSPLADVYSRAIDFGCAAGGQPTSIGLRMHEDFGLRTFGPLEQVVLVNGNHIVFMVTARVLEPTYALEVFALPQDASEIEISSYDLMPMPNLVPNPYDEFPVRLELLIDPPEDDNSSGSIDPANPEEINLVYAPGQEHIIPVGFQCSLRGGFVHVEDLSGLGADPESVSEEVRTYLALFSVFAEGFLNGDLLTIDVEHPDGSVESYAINMVDGTWISSVTQPPGSPDPDCELTGEYILTGPVPEVFGPDDAVVDGEEPEVIFEDEGDPAAGNPAPAESGSSLLPWILITIAAIAVIAVVVRNRTRARNCRPEEIAFDNAEQAYQAARRVQQERAATRDQARIRLRELQEVNRYLIAGDERDEEADAQIPGAEADLQSAEGALAAADADVTRARDLMDQAYNALLDCREERGVTGGVIPPPPPVDPGPTPPPETESQNGCSPEGSEEVRPDATLTPGQFTIPGARISLPASNDLASWNRKFGGIQGGMNAEAFMALGASDFSEALSDFQHQDSQGTKRTTVTPRIETETWRITCGRVWVCQDGQWVRTERTERLSSEKIATDTERIDGHDPELSYEEQIHANLGKAKERVEVLLANQERMQSFECE